MKKKLLTLLLALVAIATTGRAQNANGHEYVDLGLPSGTLWATCNVGASKPEEYGDYFAWGETQPKNDYSLAIYKWYSENEYTKYGNDGKTELDLEDDAANANWGSQWRMPSKEQQDELRNQCTCEWTQLNGVNGHKVTSKTNGKSIFLPAAGDRYDTSLYDAGSDGRYWSRSLNTYYPSSAYDQSFISGHVGYGYNSRYGGRSVRPVLVNNQSSGLILNAANFPDANFRAALASELGISEGDEITEEKIAATTSLKVNRKSIADLTGIEHFTALTDLECYNNQLTVLDVSKNTALTQLSCENNLLTTLDISKNIELKYLYCSGNQLTSLDVHKNDKLRDISCYRNRLSSLDVSKNIALKTLYCHDNQLTALDVLKNTVLTKLRCASNQIKGEAMDALVASLPTVEWGEFIVINTNDENEGNVCTKSQVTIAKSKGWTVYDYNGTKYQEYEGSDDAAAKLLLNAENFPDANFRAALTSILGISEGDEITEAKIAATTELSISNYGKPTSEKIADLTGIEHFTALKQLFCSDNRLTSLNVSKNTALTVLYCTYNRLTSLNVSGSTALTELACSGNQLTSLDVSKNTALTKLSCDDNQLTSLDVSLNTALERLWCDNNQLTSLNVSKNTALIQLECFNNCLPSLDVSQNTTLGCLDCGNNPLTSIDVSQNTALKFLYCYNNQLTSLDVSLNTALTELGCGRNQLTSIDVSQNTALKWLSCYSNQLTALDVSKNTALTTLYCYDNQIKGEAMDALVASLPMEENGKFYVIDTKNKNEKNVCTKEQVAVAKSKGWIVYDMNGSSKQEYEGSDDDELEAMRAELLGYVDNCRKELQGIEWRLEQKATKEQAPDLYNKILNLRMFIDEVHMSINNASTIERLMDLRYQLEMLLKSLYILREEVEAFELDIDPVDEDDNIDFGSDMDENSDLDGNVIGDIFYNIGNGNGEYNAEEGCIVLKKTTDDATVDGLSGKDIFGEDFKGQFTGIVFKVPAGKGTVKVTAETTGNMLLKVKIGDGDDPVEMELNGKLKISFPYNVSETTLVAIYAGANNEAKGFGTTNDAEDAALKIYGIEFERGEPTAIGASLNDNGKMTNDSWYTIDGKKLNGEPTKKGVYIIKGKKVKR